jgi:hypothetical protein
MSDSVSVLFLLPKWIQRGLDGGTLERVGGVIRDVDGKKVRAWLSESSEVAREAVDEAGGPDVVAILQAQVADLTSQAALHRKLDHITDVTEATLRGTLRIEGQVDELRQEQLSQLADPILEALDHLEAANTAEESGTLSNAATLGLARGRTRICRWLLARTGEQLVAELPLVRRLTHALLLGGAIEIARLDGTGAERVLDHLDGTLEAVERLVRSVKPGARLPTSRELTGMQGRKEYLGELAEARWTVGSTELRTLGSQEPVALLDADGVERGLLVVVEEREFSHVPR